MIKFKEGPEGVKLDIGIGRFSPGKMGFELLALGFGHCMGMGKKCQKSKMGMGFENCEVGFGKKMNWEMGLLCFRKPYRMLYLFTKFKSIYYKSLSQEFLKRQEELKCMGL